ncbi:hypothetical protein D3C78_1763720 [compost metagenome]
MAAGETSVAVAFEAIDGHHRAPPSAIVPTEGPEGPVREHLVIDGARRPVIDLPALLASFAPSQETPAS